MEVRIDGQAIDIEDSVIAVSRKAYDLMDLEKRFLGRSNSFNAPLTNKNRLIFKHADKIEALSDGFESVYNCDITDYGVMIFKGYATVEEAGSGGYNIQVIDRAKVLFNELSKPLNRLNLEDSDFQFGLPAYNALREANSTVWLWACDMQNEAANFSDVPIAAPIIENNIKYTRPHFNCYELLTRIFEENGWTFSDFSGDSKLKSSIISSNHKQFLVTSYQKSLNQVFTSDGVLNGLNVFDFKEASVTTSATSINIHTQKAQFRLRGNVVVSGSWSIKVSATSSPLGTDKVVESFNVTTTDTYIDFTTKLLETSEANNTVTISVSGSGSLDLSDVLLYNIIEEQALGNFSTNPLIGYWVKAYDNLIDITQIDFLRQLWTIFGFSFQTNQVEKKIEPFAYSDFLESNAVDWSDKFQEKSDLIKANVTGGQVNFFRYENSDDPTLVLEDGYATFNVQNQNLQSFSDAFVSSFAASKQLSISGEGVYTGVNFVMAYMPAYNNSTRARELSPRIKLYRPIGFIDGTISYFESFIEPTRQEDLKGIDFKTLINNELKYLIKAIKRNRYLEADFDLNKLDVISFNFGKFVYISKLGGLFLCNNISDFTSGQLTKVELIKL